MKAGKIKKSSKKKVQKINRSKLLAGVALFFLIIFYFLKTQTSNKTSFEGKSTPFKKYKEISIPITNPPLEVQVIEHGPRSQKKIALTFDADMTYSMLNLLEMGFVKSWYNKDLVNYLEKENTKATFFMTGLWVQTYSKEAKEIAKNPLFEIGNHSFSHPAFINNCYKLPLIEKGREQDEIENAQKIIIEETGVKPKYFRFPGGCYKKQDLKTVSKLGLKTIGWDVVSGDAFNNNAGVIENNILTRVKNGSIIVLHANKGIYAPQTYYAIRQVVPLLKKNGYQFVTLSELLAN